MPETTLSLSTSSGGAARAAVVYGELRHWSVYTFSGDKVVRWRSYRTRAEALDAAGLRE
jgi:hypothetical protein